jgi:hypothetical protein
VNKRKEIGLDFEVDKLTNSIENVVTGDSFATEISIVTTADLESISKKQKWLFEWKFEYKQPERDVYKMKIKTKELDVDFIGGQDNPLTKDEELAISNFIRAFKEKRELKEIRKKARTKQKQLA